MKQLPNIFTLINLLFGCLAITAALQNGITIQYSQEGTQYIDIPEKIWMASLFIGLAALVDFADGFVARLLNATSELGKQLDSLSDVVSFGVAPSVIVYQFLRMSFAKDAGGIDASYWLLAPAFFIAMAAAYRLAKFNLDVRQQNYFLGVPTPAVGMLIASFPLIYWHTDNAMVILFLTSKWFWYAIILLLSGLMLSEIPIISLKFKNYKLSDNLPKVALLAVALLSALFLGWISVPVTFIAYIILSLFFKKSIQ